MNKFASGKGEIKICVVGAGRAGLIHAENFAGRVPGARLAAISDPDERAARAAIEKLGADGYVKWYKTHTDALEDRGIDAFVVVTPTKYHRDIVVALASDGRHVLCEKPMAMNGEECDDMIAAADKRGAILQIGFMRRFDENYIKAKEALESGAIGDVVMTRSNTRGPSEPQPWMYDLAASNGPLAEVNSHDIDTLRWFTGSEFDSVYAIGGNFRSSAAKAGYPDFYDNVVLTASMKNGTQGIIDGAQGVGYAYDARVEILGTKGCIFIGRLRDDVTMSATGSEAPYENPATSGTQLGDGARSAYTVCVNGVNSGGYPLVKSWRQLFRGAYLAEDAAFAESVRNGTPPRVTGYDGKMAVMAVNAGNRSIREKRAVRL